VTFTTCERKAVTHNDSDRNNGRRENEKKRKLKDRQAGLVKNMVICWTISIWGLLKKKKQKPTVGTAHIIILFSIMPKTQISRKHSYRIVGVPSFVLHNIVYGMFHVESWVLGVGDAQIYALTNLLQSPSCIMYIMA
jgi:hypothetical protein